MTQLYTSSYRAYRPEMGQAVVTSLGLPRWHPDAEQWPRCWLLTPSPSLFREPDADVFGRLYVERLERFGAAKIARTLGRIAHEHDAEKLVLLCHEADVNRCHRGLFAAWWLQSTGEEARELIITTTETP
ncbi:MAG TPA: DUF488 family protein [Streptosporangiaceae bacterium]|nr:DUF488 family protein [Streptosporangiaceae bacterium]